MLAAVSPAETGARALRRPTAREQFRDKDRGETAAVRTKTDFPHWLSRFKRWLYRGQRPHWIARMLNRVWAVVGSSGMTSTGLVTLEVTGRTSGRLVSLPVVLVVVEGQRYLVSMLGEHGQWVRNVRAAGGRAVLRRGSRETIHLEAVPIDQRAPILQAYLQRAPGARPHVPVHKDAALAEFAKIAAAFPVFRVAAHPGLTGDRR
jgi:deazaflavin-dependent oxidoreductase (nitroreductase family)